MLEPFHTWLQQACELLRRKWLATGKRLSSVGIIVMICDVDTGTQLAFSCFSLRCCSTCYRSLLWLCRVDKLCFLPGDVRPGVVPLDNFNMCAVRNA
jgi:hypothetical protein